MFPTTQNVFAKLSQCQQSLLWLVEKSLDMWPVRNNPSQDWWTWMIQNLELLQSKGPLILESVRSVKKYQKMMGFTKSGFPKNYLQIVDQATFGSVFKNEASDESCFCESSWQYFRGTLPFLETSSQEKDQGERGEGKAVEIRKSSRTVVKTSVRLVCVCVYVC